MKMYSPAKKIGELLTTELTKNPHFYFFSPDETTSNLMGQVFTAGRRAWYLPREGWDLPEGENGRIVEMLSENVLFSVMTGHLMNGEPAMMASYEAFFSIITAQVLQQIKFIKQAKEVAWRRPLPAVNLLSTSTCWRQDHNGFTHQSPALISMLLDLPSNLANCFFPVDDVAAEVVYRYMINAKDEVNLATFNKIDEPRMLSPEQARSALDEGAIICDWAPYENPVVSNAADQNVRQAEQSATEPDLVFAAVGDLMAKEATEAMRILGQDIPELKLRLVYINTLSYGAIGRHDHKMPRERFNQLFTADKPIIADFHGYPATLEQILGNYTERRRVYVHGYKDEGSTTTPMEMLRRSHASRYDLATTAAKLYGRSDLAQKYQQKLAENHAYAVANGQDML